jgi:hypothetical protein
VHGVESSLVGRQSELGAVASLLADASEGRGRVVLVVGDAGIGKTSLAEAADAMARPAGFDVAWGRCSAADLPAYWPWLQILSASADDKSLFDHGRFTSRPELFAAVADAIVARARQHPLLVVFEDAHWADPASLALLEFLADMVAGQRLVLFVTARETAAPLLASPGVRQLTLEGLDRAETEALVARILGTEPTAEYLAEVHQRTGGNPFFAIEVARLQRSRGTLTGKVPSAVRQVLERRLARLNQDAFELLQVASVLGAPDVAGLARITGRTPAELLALLEEPAAAGVIVGAAFAHELMRETLYEAMSPSQRAILHRQVAEHLQGAGPAELAYHWSLASGDDAPARAARLAVMAGDWAVAALAHEQAIKHYRTALQLGGGDLSVRRRLGEAQVQAGHLGSGRDTLRRVAQDAVTSNAAEELALAVLGMGGGVGGFEVDVLDRDQLPLLEQALRLLPERDSALRAALLARRAVVHTGRATGEERAAVAQEAVAMARRVGDGDAEVAALAALCDAQSGPDHVRDRIDATGRMLGLARGHAPLELLARRIRLRARLELGDLTGVEAEVAAYARISDRLRSPAYGWLVPLWRGMLAVQRSDLTAADEFANEVARLAQLAGSTNAQMMAWGLRWSIARRRRDVPALRAMTAAMAEWSDDFPAWDCSYAWMYAQSGDLERGRRHLRRLMEAGLTSVPKDAEWLELLWALGEAAMLLDEREAAAAVRQALEPYADLWAVDGFGCACFGQVSDLLARLATYDEADAPPTGRSAFARTGSVWRVEFRGRSTTLVDSKGMRDLAQLLAKPGQEVSVLDLVEAAGGPARAVAGTDTGPVIDAAARAAYRRRLTELDEEIDEASRNHDDGRTAHLAAEKDFLVAELTAAFGIGGRPRITGDRTERARKAVTMRISTALKAIDAVHPELCRHLRNSVSTGRTCSYRPDQSMTWEITQRG